MKFLCSACCQYRSDKIHKTWLIFSYFMYRRSFFMAISIFLPFLLLKINITIAIFINAVKRDVKWNNDLNILVLPNHYGNREKIFSYVKLRHGQRKCVKMGYFSNADFSFFPPLCWINVFFFFFLKEKRMWF